MIGGPALNRMEANGWRPELLLEMAGIDNFDVSPDGLRFVISRFPVESAAREIHVVLNWFEELKRLAPTD